jgi:hypothetical protein
MEQPTNIVTCPLRTTDQDDRNRAILGLTSDDPLPEANGENLLKYHAYLAAHLSFPFRAVYWRDTGPFQSRKHTVSVVGLISLDDYYPSEGHGLLCEVQHDADSQDTVVQGRAKDRGGLLGFLWKMLGLSGRQEEEQDDDDNCMPLDEIEVKKDSPNQKLIADYSYWFHNH